MIAFQSLAAFAELERRTILLSDRNGATLLEVNDKLCKLFLPTIRRKIVFPTML